MAEGLRRLLEQIRKQPTNRTISRYLALISDTADEGLRLQQALELAEALTARQPLEAMRIAYMAYQAEPTNGRAFDIMIGSLTARGRFAKAEVLRHEKERLQQMQTAEQQNFAQSVRRQLPQDLAKDSLLAANAEQAPIAAKMQDPLPPLPRDLFAPRRSPKPHLEPTAIPEPMTLHLSRIDATPLDQATTILPPPAVEEAAVVPDERPAMPSNLGQRSLSGLPNERVLPFRAADLPKLAAAENQSGQPQALVTSMVESVEMVERADLAVAIDLFDHYWRQGFVREASDLIKQMEPFAAQEAWWQARHILVDRSQRSHAWDAFKPLAAVVSAETSAAFSWEALLAKLKDLQALAKDSGRSASPALQPWSLAQFQQAMMPFKKSIQTGSQPVRPADFINQLIPLAVDLTIGLALEAHIAIQREIVQIVWSDTVDAQLSRYLKQLQLTHIDPYLWSRYLDSLLQDRDGRAVLHDVRQTLRAKPVLLWARVAYPYLERAWDLIGVVGFTWHEEDGLMSLQKALDYRRPPTLRALLLQGR